jgi:hypothetical protein
MDAVLSEPRQVLRTRLDLPEDRPVVLHLPLPRPDAELDAEAWAEALGDRVYLLVTGGAEPSTRLRHAVRALGPDDDLSAAIAAADLIVSDYSPRIGDAVAADRPVALYQPDRGVFLDRTCGVYPGLEQVGPVLVDQPALHQAIEQWLGDRDGWANPWAPGRRAWGESWVGPPSPGASERAARAILAALGEVS